MKIVVFFAACFLGGLGLGVALVELADLAYGARRPGV